MIAASVVLLLIAAVIVFRPAGYKPVEQVYFYDLSSQSLYADSSKLLPPVESPGGGEGVWAYVMSCGDCADESSRQIGYLMTHTPAYKKKLVEGGDVPPHMGGEGILVRATDGDQWVTQASAQGAEIISDAQSVCDNNQTPTVCTP